MAVAKLSPSDSILIESGVLSTALRSLSRGLGMTNVMTANFYGTALYGTKIGDVVYVALKPIVEALELEWSAQFRRVQRDPVLSQGIAVMAIPSFGGTQETIGLKLSMIPGWLFKISALRIKSQAIRSKVILFQRECYDVLARHFLEEGRRPDEHSQRRQSLSVRMAREARLLFGRHAGAEVWFQQGLPSTPSMTTPPKQHDLFSWRPRKIAKKR